MEADKKENSSGARVWIGLDAESWQGMTSALRIPDRLPRGGIALCSGRQAVSLPRRAKKATGAKKVSTSRILRAQSSQEQRLLRRKRAEGKAYHQRKALARRRVNVLWAMLRDGTTTGVLWRLQVSGTQAGGDHRPQEVLSACRDLRRSGVEGEGCTTVRGSHEPAETLGGGGHGPLCVAGRTRRTASGVRGRRRVETIGASRSG